MTDDVNPDRSVNCYFCSALVDQRDCIVADDYNGHDGGSICGTCNLAGEAEDEEEKHARFMHHLEGGE